VVEPDPVIDLDAPDAPVEDDNAVERPITGSVTFTPPEEADPPAHGPTARASRGGRVAVADGVAAGARARAENVESSGPPTMAVPAGDSSEDAYLTSLRKAMLDDTSASTLEPDEHRTRARFGRRR
jgi:hypothetical protein